LIPLLKALALQLPSEFFRPGSALVQFDAVNQENPDPPGVKVIILILNIKQIVHASGHKTKIFGFGAYTIIRSG